LSAIALVTAASSLAQAQQWPARAITMVVGTAAGGGADILARILASRLTELLGQPVVIENVGNSVAAAKRVATAQPNGYVVDFGFSSTHALHPSLYKKPFYDVVGDFTPVALFAEQPYFVVTRRDFPASNLMEFASYAKANAERLQYASGTGIGSLNHLSCALLNAALGLKITLVPYRDQGTATQDMIAGRIDYLCALPATMIPLIENNQIKGIAMTGMERLPVFPKLASVHEQGVAGFDVTSWYALYFPKGVPDPIVRRLNEATVAAMNTPAVQERVRPLGATLASPERRSPEYLQKFLLTEIEKWVVPIKAAGIALD